MPEYYELTFQYFYQLSSNNSKLGFLDEEIVTIYLFGIMG